MQESELFEWRPATKRLSTRARNCILNQVGHWKTIESFDELLKMKDRQLLKLPYFGKKLLSEWRALFPSTEPASGWQPISTAPKDGTPILVFWDEEYKTGINTCKWDGQAWRSTGCCDDIWHCDPTHWTPLPKPPEGE